MILFCCQQLAMPQSKGISGKHKSRTGKKSSWCLPHIKTEKGNNPGGRKGQKKQQDFKNDAAGCTTVTPLPPSVAALTIEKVYTPEHLDYEEERVKDVDEDDESLSASSSENESSSDEEG
jgi:hypothetical protein